MRLLLRKPSQSLDKAYARQPISHDRMDTFRRALARLFLRLDENESEEYQKNILAGFLGDAFYEGEFEVNTRDRIGLIIHHKPGVESPGVDSPSLIIGVKRVFAGEMMTTIKNNVRALHELILYYFEARERHQKTNISQLIITDVYNWFIFDEADFRHFFYNNAKLRKLYQVKQQHRDNPFFYGEVAKILRDLDDEVPVTCIDLRKTADALKLPDQGEANRLLIPVYKLFSPEHLLKLPFANNGNTLNRSFYNELLHIIGLHETLDGGPSSPGRKLIQRLPEGERHNGSLLENTINQLRVGNALASIETPEQYGVTEADQLFGVGLGLCITWLNRILFLKLLEGQLVRYHRDDRSLQFLTPRHVREFDELNELFFEVLAVPEANRPAGIINRYGPVPYLNSSLFELTDLERQILTIRELEGQLTMPLFGRTALNDAQGEPLTGQLATLQYLLTFLDAYDFSSDGPAGVQPDNKPLINAAGLGLVFEKLNSYRDGSWFTPGFITMYMVRDAIRRAVLERFNETFFTEPMRVNSIDELTDYLSRFNKPDDLLRVNAIVNSLRIVDPAVGSGHFLVSALNELIALKAELGILADRDGQPLRHYEVSVVNDELMITDADGEPFQYYAPIGRAGAPALTSSFSGIKAEIQRVQELIFHEKQTLIENCLFGVDINPNAISICRLRLWIELLKSTYYKTNDELRIGPAPADRPKRMNRSRTGGPAEADERPVSTSPAHSSFIIHHSLQTLPNLDINFKSGNSLVSRFPTTFRVDSLRNQFVRERFLSAFQQYRVDVPAYRYVRDRAEKDRIRESLREFRELIDQIALADRKEYAAIRRLEAKLAQSAQTFDFVSRDDRLQTETDLLAAKKRAFAGKQRVFRQAFEWRFEFPEALDEAGNFVGFDVVVSNPPAIRPDDAGDYGAQFRRAFPNTYAGAADPYVLFIEQALNLLRPGGQFIGLLPNKWLRAGYGANLRKWLKTKAIGQITDFGDLPVFDEATNNVSILALRNAETTGVLQAGQVDTLRFGRYGLAAYLADRTFTVSMAPLQDGGWVLTDTTVQNLLVKLKNTGIPLGTYVGNRIFYGLKTGLNEAFVINAKTRDQLIAADPRSADVIRPFLADRDVQRYRTPVATKFLILLERGITARERGDSEPEDWLLQTYPAIYAWLKPLEAKAKARSDQGMYWWELRAFDDYPAFEKPHIIVSATGTEPAGTWNESGGYANDRTIIVATATKYVLAILNSRVADFVMRRTAPKKSTGHFDYKPAFVAQIPIPDILPDAQAPLIALVDAILATRREDPEADTSSLEAQLDGLVVDLYGLSAAERALVSGVQTTDSGVFTGK